MLGCLNANPMRGRKFANGEEYVLHLEPDPVKEESAESFKAWAKAKTDPEHLRLMNLHRVLFETA